MVNPLLEPSPRPYGVPDFAALGPEDYLEAIRVGAGRQAAEVAAIAADPAPAGFANTFVALERSGQDLRRARAAYSTVRASHATAGILAVDATIQSTLAAHDDAVHLDPGLYARLSAVDTSALEGEDARLAAETLRRFRRAGAGLPGPERARLRELNGRLAELGAEYTRRIEAGLNAAGVWVGDAGRLAGLSDDEVAAARDAAAAAGRPDGYLLPLALPSAQPVLERLGDAELRRRVHEASVGRGSDGEHATLGIAARIAALRAERAGLLGYGSHAEYALEDRTAPSLGAVRERLAALAAPAVRNAAREDARIGGGSPVAPWDRARGLARVRREEHSVDAEALRDWFELERVVADGVFGAATALYGVAFRPRPDVVGWHPAVRTWEVFDADGSPLGLFMADYFTRPTKSGGAWMDSLRDGASLWGERPVVTNNLNLVRPAPGRPALLGLDEVRTLFHEFGHALHGLFSAGKYASLAGTSVPRDFVEYPSQANEMWALWPSLAGRYAVHHETGAPLPPGTLDRLAGAAAWGQGFATTEYLAAAVLDLAWHGLAPGDAVEDPAAFEDRALRDAGFDPDAVPPRYRTGYFKHVFSGWYSAGYYSYVWSEVLAADTGDWFEERGGPARANGDAYRAELLSRGNTRDPLESYRAFRGRDAAIGPLLARRGLDA